MTSPSRLRYKREHPTVSFVLTREIKELLDEHRGDISYGAFLKNLVLNFNDAIKEIEKRGVIRVHCGRCGREIIFSPARPGWGTVEKLVKSKVWNCGCKHKEGGEA
ncbi:MAG: hypothetical protein QXH42_10140 [Thermoplasmata archaeon]